jgi:DNA invertase Pin-like site-specific DNA recombinase
MKRVGLYLRVSTDQQTVENQRRELTAACEHRGWSIITEFADEGISGSKGRDKRPAFDRLHKAIVRRQIDVVAAWSVDRLGRSLQDLVGFLAEVQAAGCDLYLHTQGLDTSTPAGRAMFGMLSVFGEFERAMIVERVRAGLARAKANGTRSGKAIGRPALTGAKVEIARRHLLHGASIRATAIEAGISVGACHRLAVEMRASTG